MYHAIPARSNRLFEGHSRVINPAAIHEIDDAFRTLGPELSRHGVDNQASPIFRALALSYVHHGADEFNEIARWAEDRMASDVDISDFAAGMNDSVIQLEIRFFTLGCLIRFPEL